MSGRVAGVGLVTRKMGNAISPVVELVKNGDKFTLRTTSTFKNTELSFANGETVDEETADGRKVKVSESKQVEETTLVVHYCLA
jgi:fatty acid-binding protein 3, muscle and heart